MTNPLIIKLGGVLLDSEEALARLFEALLTYRSAQRDARLCVAMRGYARAATYPTAQQMSPTNPST